MPSLVLAPNEFQIIWLSNLLSLTVPDKWVFQKRVLRTNFDIYVFLGLRQTDVTEICLLLNTKNVAPNVMDT